MDQVAVRLEGGGPWLHLGGADDARKPLEVVLRSFDAEVEFATGSDAKQPDGETVRVPAGEGRRLAGRHFFARAAVPCRVTYRGC